MAVYIYPAQSVVASNPSVGINGNPAPLSSTQVAGNDGTNLVPLSVNSAGALALPQGASTSAKQDVGNASLASIDSKVATAAKQDVGNASLSSIDSKVATAANQVTTNSNLNNIENKLTSTIDANNSTTTPLGISGVFTGVATDVSNYGTISVLVASNVAAAAGGLSFQFSNDGTNWDHSHNFDFAGGNLSYNVASEGRYFRLVFTNDGVAQTYLRLQTVLRRTSVPPSQYAISQTLSGSALATPTKSVIFGLTTGGGGGYVPVKVNPSGALTVEASVTSSSLPTGAATAANQTSVQSSPGSSAATAITVQGSASGVALPVSTTSTGSNGGTPTSFVTQIGGVTPTATLAPLQLDSSANLKVAVEGSALPTGAATESTLATRASESTLSALNGKIPSNLTVSSTRLLVDGSGVTQPISAASLPLPTGAATETTLSALNQRLAGSLVPVKYDEIAITYVTAGNGVGEIQTAVFKLATVTVKTLTLSYDSSNRLSGVVATQELTYGIQV